MHKTPIIYVRRSHLNTIYQLDLKFSAEKTSHCWKHNLLVHLPAYFATLYSKSVPDAVERNKEDVFSFSSSCETGVMEDKK